MRIERLPLLDARRVPRLAVAPRLHPALHEALVALDDPDVPIAETYRRLAAFARGRRLFRPSYEHVRRLIHAIRRIRAARARGGTAKVLLQVAYNVRPPTALVDHLLDVGPAPT